MAHIINCGEQDIEEDGISISLSVIGDAENISPDDLFISIIDSLLGVSEFIAECKYNYAEVSIDFNLASKEGTDYKEFEEFFNTKRNEEVSMLFHKYCDYFLEETIEEDGTLWFYFNLKNIGAEMTDEDHAEFCKIFKERLK